MKVGLYGGSFDPVHHGHLLTALWASEKRELQKIIFMPCFISPLRQFVNMATGGQRVKMLQLATQDNQMFEVSDYEIIQEGVSYTINTILMLKKLYNTVELIIGYDNYLIFDKWNSHEEILDLVNVIVLKRVVEKDFSVPDISKKRMVFLETPPIGISSTEIRRRVLLREQIDFFTPKPVIEYIHNNNLYIPLPPIFQ